MSLSLRVFFDFSCPYCYLAWGFVKQLKTTLPLEDDWVSWEIHPNAPRTGAKIQDLIPDIDLAARREKLNSLGEPVGLLPGKTEFVPNTRAALQICELARQQHKLHQWIDSVYHASFVELKNIGDQAVLLDIARHISLDTEEILTILATDRYLPVLLANDQECVDKKIEWVPTIYSGDVKILEGSFTYSHCAEVLTAYAKANHK